MWPASELFVHTAIHTDEVGPYRRMPASQANTYNVPSPVVLSKVYRFKMPQIPVLFVEGRQEAVCRVLKESPGFIVATSSADVAPPLR